MRLPGLTRSICLVRLCRLRLDGCDGPVCRSEACVIDYQNYMNLFGDLCHWVESRCEPCV